MSETGTRVSHAQTTAPETAGLQAELVVGGMTCGACAARIERRLNRLDGVAATVNYATGRAYFASTGGRDPAELIGVIESAGTIDSTMTATASGPQTTSRRASARVSGSGCWPSSDGGAGGSAV